jgi:signal transduction histidine kinase
MLLLLGLQRLSYLAPSLVGQRGADHLVVATGLLVTTLGWNAAIFTLAYRRGWFPAWVAAVDVAWAAALYIAVPASLPPGAADGPLDWSGRIGQAAAALGGAALATPYAVAAVAGLVGVHVGHTYARLHGTPELVPELVTCVNGLVWFAVIIGIGFRYLCRQGRRLDEATALRLRAEAQHARDQTRLAHHRALHDTVLTTLTAIARGAGAASAEVRRRCASDADYIRRLIRRDGDVPEASLVDRLDQAVVDAEALGLRVHYAHDPLPDDLSPAVVDALGGAVREALNNVVKHAAADAAWLTAVAEDDGVVVRVVDRGRGFDPDAARTGFGLRTSIVEPMAAAGGAASLSSAVGEGTCVELTWSR